MVEKIIVNPNEIRGYGNIISPKTSTDFTPSTDYKIVTSTDTVNGEETTVYGIESKYSLSFDSSSYTTSTGSCYVQITVQEGSSYPYTGTVYVTGAGGSGSGNLTVENLGIVNINVTGINTSGTLTATYKSAKATAPVTYQTISYSLAFSQSTYTIPMLSNITISCTLTNGGTPMSGETVTFNCDDTFPSSFTETTNSSGVASHTFDYMDFMVLPTTVTAVYQGVSTTCTIEEEGLI